MPDPTKKTRRKVDYSDYEKHKKQASGYQMDPGSKEVDSPTPFKADDAPVVFNQRIKPDYTDYVAQQKRHHGKKYTGKE